MTAGRKAAKGVVGVFRGDIVESRHTVHIAVVDAGGKLRAAANDANTVFYSRSAIKPLQAVPLVDEGGADRFELSPAELALCCASHNGEMRHVEAARSMLRKIGASEDALACGPHAPYHEPSATALREAGQQPTRIHNNCSGKHAGMLALAQHLGWSLTGYHELSHPVQQRMLREIEEWTKLPTDEIALGVDGCGVVTFGGPLSSFAAAFARFAAAARKGNNTAARIAGAMTQNPEYVAGTGRLCTALMRVANGRIFAKVGAEGVYLVGVPGAELGIGIKVEDGSLRAVEPALIATLRALSLLSDEEAGALDEFREPRLRNTRNEEVGFVRADIQLSALRG